MTGGDCFETDPMIKKAGLSFGDWVKRQQNEFFQSVVPECQRRIILFNNRTDDVEKERIQMRQLVGLIRSLASKGKRYTNRDFEKVEEKRVGFLRNLHHEQENQDIINRIGILSSRLKNAPSNEEGAGLMQAVSDEIETLNNVANVALEKNSRVQNSIKLFPCIREALQAKRKEVDNIIAYNKKVLNWKTISREKGESAKPLAMATPTNSLKVEEKNQEVEKEEKFQALLGEETRIKIEELDKQYLQIKTVSDFNRIMVHQVNTTENQSKGTSYFSKFSTWVYK